MPTILPLPHVDPAIEIFVASHGMAQGLSQTNGPQVIPRVTVRIGPAQIGSQWRNISSPTANGVAAFFVRTSRNVGKVQVDGGVAYRIRTGAKAGSAYRAWEFSGGIRRTFGPVALRAIVEYSPDEFGSGHSLYIEGGPAIDLGKTVKLSVNSGRRERHGGPDYTSFNGGLSALVEGKLLLDARYYATNRSGAERAYRPRIVVSARLTL